MKQGRNLSFYIELVVMLVISVLVITVAAAAFARSDIHSRDAKRLSDAVTLAASGAECFLAADNSDDLLDMLNEADNAYSVSPSSDQEKADSAEPFDMVFAAYNDDLEPSSDGNMKMAITWMEQDGFATATVTVSYKDSEIYSLETGAAKKAEGGGR